MDSFSLLRASELFGQFDDDVVTLIAKECRTVTYDRNDRVFDEGDEADSLFVVRDGRVAIANRSFDGKESVVALMEEGDLFGDMGLFDGLPRSAEARALEPSQLVIVPYPPIRALFNEQPQLLFDVVAFLSRRLRTTDSALADAVFLDVTGRTAKRLLEISGDADEFTMPLTQEELAAMVGASRERVNKAIATFVRLGWITQADRHYRITDRAQLQLRSR
jgi:CRP/FNR family cyclic AMP-dependent transcriptional regulator